ncbi:hypothetical protein HYDPIDRAFT_32308 [Hydnomerulius pinastri MD-312]|uniref:Uncharacterized protein n=1 Tax=Hydnomerulius pinastri MD-312 TaxID=994086 RepID=A0A0C9WAS0_9AGAM|nr:hypothetical protein HYDPIDRAFT_32308 [Hydnomerulius pinastri MD-312]
MDTVMPYFRNNVPLVWAVFIDSILRFLPYYVPRHILSPYFRLYLTASPTPLYTDLNHTCIDSDTGCQSITPTPAPVHSEPPGNYTDHHIYPTPAIHPSDSSIIYVFLNTSAWEGEIPSAERDEIHPPKVTVPVGDRKKPRAPTDLVTYKSHGVNFCPAKAIVIYIKSMLKGYALLMIPIFVAHWMLERWSVDDVCNEQLDWLFQLNLWAVPWLLLRYNSRKAMSYLPRLFRWIASRRAVSPPVLRIHVIRVDGEAVPATFDMDPHGAAHVDDVGDVWNQEIGAGLILQPPGPETAHDIPSLASDPNVHSYFAPESRSDTMEPCLQESTTTINEVFHSGEVIGAAGGYSSGSISCSRTPNGVRKVHRDQPRICHAPEGVSNGLHVKTTEAAPDAVFPNAICPSETPSSPCDLSESTIHEVETGPLNQAVRESPEIDQDTMNDTKHLERAIESGEEAYASGPWEIVDASELEVPDKPSDSAGLDPATPVLDSSPAPPIVKSVRFAIPNELEVEGRCQVVLVTPQVEGSCRGSDSKEEDPEVGGTKRLQVLTAQESPLIEDFDLAGLGEVVTALDSAPVPDQDVEELEDEKQQVSKGQEDTLIVDLHEIPKVHPMELAEGQQETATQPDIASPAFSTPDPVIVKLPVVELVRAHADLLTGSSVTLSPAPIRDTTTRSPPQEQPTEFSVVINMARHIPETVSVPEEQPPTPQVSLSLSLDLTLCQVETTDDEMDEPKTALNSDREPSIPPTSPTEIVIAPSVQSPKATIELGVASVRPPLEIDDSREVGSTLALESSLSTPMKGEALDFSPGTQSDSLIPCAATADAPTYASKHVQATEQLTAPSQRIRSAARSFMEFVPRHSKSAGENNAKLSHEAKDDRVILDVLELPVKTENVAPRERLLTASIHALTGSRSPSREVPRPAQLSAPELHDAHKFYTTRPGPIALSEAKPFSRLPAIADNTTQRLAGKEARRNLSASIHAPQTMVEPVKKVAHAEPQVRHAELAGDHRRHVTSPFITSCEWNPVPDPSPPNWAAVPGELGATNSIKRTHSFNRLRSYLAPADCTIRRPKSTVNQKGSATYLVDSTSVAAPSFANGNALDVPVGNSPSRLTSNPFDFRLRTCSSSGVTNVNQGTITTPAQQILAPTMQHGTFFGQAQAPYMSQHKTGPVNSDFSSNNHMAAGPPRIQRRNIGMQVAETIANPWAH